MACVPRPSPALSREKRRGPYTVRADEGVCFRQLRPGIEERGLTQVQAAEVLGVTQPKISALLRGRLEGFSMDRLVSFRNALGQDVKISVRPKIRARPAIWRCLRAPR